MKIYQLLEGFKQMLMNRIYLIECFWYYVHHHQHYHYRSHHHGHHTIDFITIGSGLNVPTFAYNQQAAGCRFWENIRVLRFNFPFFLLNLKLWLSIPKLWGVARSHCGGHNKDIVHTVIKIDIMISAKICHPLPTAHDLPPGAWWLQLFKSLN